MKHLVFVFIVIHAVDKWDLRCPQETMIQSDNINSITSFGSKTEWLLEMKNGHEYRINESPSQIKDLIRNRK